MTRRSRRVTRTWRPGSISYKRGHKYLVVVVDHDSGNLVWAAPGRDKATVRACLP